MITRMTSREVANLYNALSRMESVPSKHGPIPTDYVKRVLLGGTNSLEAVVETSGERHLAAVPDEYENVLNRIHAEKCLEDLAQYSTAMEAAVRAYYGVGMSRPRTTAEIAGELGVSRQAIEQRIQRGIRYLKSLYGVN